MDNLLGPLLVLLIMLIGVSVIVLGPKGPSKIFGFLVAPFGCLLKLGFGLLVLWVLGMILMQSMPDVGHIFSDLFKKNRTQDPGPTEEPQSSQAILLDQYKPLGQKDLSIYESEEFALSPDGNKKIYQKACLAVVYLMLVRTHQNPHAVIGPEQYNTLQGASDPRGFLIPRKGYYSPSEVASELRNGHPVILFASDPGGFTHYVLAVGYSPKEGTITINDPNSGSRSTISASDQSPSISGLPRNTVTAMRLVDY